MRVEDSIIQRLVRQKDEEEERQWLEPQRNAEALERISMLVFRI